MAGWQRPALAARSSATGLLMVLGMLISLVALAPAPAHADELCFGEPATIVGTDGDDDLTGTSGRDVIVGLGGDDDIWGAYGDDLLCGNGGEDDIWGGQDNDSLDGGEDWDGLD